MEPQPEVKHVILFAAVNAGTLVLAECADGSLRLLRDDVPLDGCRWQYDQIKDAVAAFHSAAAKARQDQ
jgi:hypothetical protein